MNAFRYILLPVFFGIVLTACSSSSQLHNTGDDNKVTQRPSPSTGAPFSYKPIQLPYKSSNSD